MTRLSSLVGGGGGPHFKDPRLFPKLIQGNAAAGTSGGIGFIRGGPGFEHLGDNSAWSYYGVNNGNLIGANLDSDWTAGTYKTLLNVASGSGYVSSIVGPASTASSQTCTCRITVDGTVYTTSITITAASRRPIWGAMFSPINIGTTTSSSSDIRNNLMGDVGISQNLISPMTVQEALSRGVGLLRFDTSLHVEMAFSENHSTTTNQARRCGIFYQLDA